MPERRLNDRIAAACVWVAAFCLASGVFFSIAINFQYLPPTRPSAIGVVTVERLSKLKDYLGAALFMGLVPLLTVAFQRVGTRALQREQQGVSENRRMLVALLFTAPFLLSPLFALPTGKVGWILLLPFALAYAGLRALQFVATRLWFREMFREEMRPFHALLLVEALAWIVFRYLVTWRRIAHYPTLLLELTFIVLFAALFWVVALYASRLAFLLFAVDAGEGFRRITVGALPLVLLPLVAVVFVPTLFASTAVVVALVLSAALGVGWRRTVEPALAWKLCAYLLMPALIYLVSYASTADLSQWIDLFHRGETIGPASDYLRGKAPYREVLALHGMLEDGLLDAWLMKVFGRSLEVVIMRSVVLGGLLAVTLWYLGIAIFRSIPLALLVVAMGSWTTAENSRTFFQIVAVALFWVGSRNRKPLPLVISGVFAAFALFFSYEIGLYTIAAAVLTSLLLGVARRRVEWDGLEPWRIAVLFAAGVLLGASPFLIYLASRGALRAFAEVSFVTIPQIIDPVWSLPFPDLITTFRSNLSIHTLADFVVWEKFHLILSPLSIAVALAYLIQRWLRRRSDPLDFALLVLAVFAAVSQRSALGRAEFRHQYFAAFLVGPLLVVLAVLFVRKLRALWLSGADGDRAFTAAIVTACALAVATLFWIPDLISARLDDLIRYQARVTRSFRDGHAEEVRHRIREVSAQIVTLTGPDEPIFDYSNQPAFYFFANRPNPTRFYQVPIISPRRFQAEVIRDLERARPKVIIKTSPEGFDRFDNIPNALRTQAVEAYVLDCYRFYRSIRGVELWTRRPDARPAAMSVYLRQIRLPSKTELAAGGYARLVFPLVGSAGGLGGSYWVSEVTLHNPFRDPIWARMRYVSGPVRADRVITLAPRQTMRWPDIVRTFFGAPDTIGTLWVWHRAGRAPVMVVKTADVAHGSRATVEAPLSARDTATAGSESAELTIVGVPSAAPGGRRVNIGIVNVGIIPAGFEITLRTRTGARIGRTVDGGVPEDEVWLVNDIEQTAGAQIDENVTIHITAIAGTGAAFAAVVAPNGETEFLRAVPSQQP